jgi:hypothetical protein
MQIQLDWADNVEADLLGYRVYRDGVAIADLGKVSQYTDTIPDSSLAVSYKVIAIDTSLNESLPSTIVTTVLTPPTLHKFIIVEGSNSVKVSWKKVDYAKVLAPRTTLKGVDTITITGI